MPKPPFRMPNFLIIGATKSGTTSLYHYLRQHPQVFMSPEKEPHFFAFQGETVDFQGPGDRRTINRMVVSDLREYQALFRRASDERAIGEASAMYLYSSKAPRRIYERIPDAKLIAILRNPVDRAYSAFLHLLRDGREPIRDFRAALESEGKRKRKHWSYLWYYRDLGYYFKQLSRFYKRFSPDQIRIYLYEDLVADVRALIEDLFRFLEVDDTWVPDFSLRHNVSGLPRSKNLHTFLRRDNSLKRMLKPFLPGKFRKRLVVGLLNLNLRQPPPLDETIRQELLDGYRKDIESLQNLIGRDLRGWLG